jgi:hypothetical protein
MTANIDLVCVEGPLAGERVPLSPAAPMLIGRSKRGLHLPDPLVSIEHAEISWTTDRYFIVDLGSLSGTFLDERRLTRDPTPLLPGMTLQVGESTFKVEIRRVRPLWFWPLVLVMVVTGTMIASFMLAAAQPVVYAPTLHWGVPIKQAGVESGVVPIPLRFVRQYGLDNRDLILRRVTDYDRDGVDELWMDTPVDHLVITFVPGAEGTDWKVLGRFPRGCYDRPALDFPDQRCDGVLYFYERGQYVLADNDGIVGWIETPPAVPSNGQPPPAPSVAPAPFRFTLIEREKLAGFLQARGVTERVHYLVCEEALPGLKAQVLTQEGEIKPLDYGCLGDLVLSGAAELSSRSPKAVAFTATGREALVDDIATWLVGSPDGLFHDPQTSAVVSAIDAEPTTRVMMRLAFNGIDVGVDPVADEKPVAGVRRLLPSGTVPSLPAPLASTVALDGPGLLRVDPPGCSELEIETTNWTCALSRFCTPGQEFLTVRQTGCGVAAPTPIMTVPYRNAGAAGGDPNVQLRVALQLKPGTRRVDVLRARVSWRVPPPPAAPTEEKPAQP